MSDAAEQGGMSPDTAGASERPRRDPGQAPGNGKKRSPSRGIVIAVIGGLVTAGVAAAIVLPGLLGDGSDPAGSVEEPALSALAPADINAALPTLDPTTSKTAVDDAKACKAPLAWVTLTQQPGGRGGMVRIRSGTYTSPPIQLTTARQRIAIPYPAPYPTGRGVLSLVGDADQVGFYLSPGRVVPSVKGAYSINVRWVVRNPCP